MWEMNDVQMAWWLYTLITLGLLVVGIVLFWHVIRMAIQFQREEHEQKMEALKFPSRPQLADTVELDQAAVSRYRVFSTKGASYTGIDNGSLQLHRWAYEVGQKSVLVRITTQAYTKDQLEEQHQIFESQAKEYQRLYQNISDDLQSNLFKPYVAER